MEVVGERDVGSEERKLYHSVVSSSSNRSVSTMPGGEAAATRSNSRVKYSPTSSWRRPKEVKRVHRMWRNVKDEKDEK